MASRGARSSRGRLDETDGKIDAAEFCLFAQVVRIIFGSVDIVAGTACAPFVLVDMEIVEIEISIAKIRSLRGAGLGHLLGIMTFETEIFVDIETCIESFWKRLFEHTKI